MPCIWEMETETETEKKMIMEMEMEIFFIYAYVITYLSESRYFSICSLVGL